MKSEARTKVREVYRKGALILKLCFNEKFRLHNTTGPAFTRYKKNGQPDCEQYLVNGRRHREDGPAVIRYKPDGKISYAENWLNGDFYGSTDLEKKEIG